MVGVIELQPNFGYDDLSTIKCVDERTLAPASDAASRCGAWGAVLVTR
jgi:hypothetical protein